jgi:NAD(P)H-nitrite reductase large subunit
VRDESDGGFHYRSRAAPKREVAAMVDGVVEPLYKCATAFVANLCGGYRNRPIGAVLTSALNGTGIGLRRSSDGGKGVEERKIPPLR